MIENWTQTAFLAVIIFVMLLGLAGLIIPVLPGLVMIWLAALVYWIATGFTWITWVALAVLTVLMIGGSVIDNILMGASARMSGASWLGIGIALLAGILGSIFLTPIGGLLLALLGIFIVEIIRLRDWRKALNSTTSMAIGCGSSAFVRFAIGCLMILIWAIVSFYFPAM